MEHRPIRVLIAKVGLDGQDREAKILTRALRDSGMEVIYTGLHQTPEMVVGMAVQEDVDVVGLPLFSGAHLTLVPRVIQGLYDAGRDDALIVVSGHIPPADIAPLTTMGVAAVFGPGTSLATQITFIRDHAPRSRAGKA